MIRNGYWMIALWIGWTAFLGCGDIDVQRVPLEDQVLQGIDRGRATGLPETLGPIRPIAIIQRPAVQDWAYRMASPVAVLGLGRPVCRVLVADLLDQALHLFRFDGSYERSINLLDALGAPVRTVSELRRVDGERRVEFIDSRRQQAVSIDLDGGDVHVQPEMPFAREASLRRQLGHRFLTSADSLLTEAVNAGTYASFGDVVWFGRFSDARIFRGRWDGGLEPRLDLVFEPPLSYEMARPERYSIEGRPSPPVLYEHHLQTFAAASDGTFAFVQTVVPSGQWALVTADSLVQEVAYHEVGRILAISLIDDLVVALETLPEMDSWSDRRQISVYRNPTARRGGGCTASR